MTTRVKTSRLITYHSTSTLLYGIQKKRGIAFQSTLQISSSIATRLDGETDWGEKNHAGALEDSRETNERAIRVDEPMRSAASRQGRA